jgi:two-component system, sensor histidine kinase PdtaS
MAVRVSADPTAGVVSMASSSALSERDQERLHRALDNMPLVADLSSADLMLLVPAGRDEMQVVVHAQPQPVPSLYSQSQVGKRVGRAESPLVFRCIDAPNAHHERAIVISGVPTMHEAMPIMGDRGVIAVLVSEMAMLEHERQRKRDITFRRAIAHVREMLRLGLLQGGEALGRLGLHDGVLIIDKGGQIRYTTVVAEHLYRRLGYPDSIVDTQLSDLETNEYICFKAMERNVCMEQRVEEQDQIWIKRVIPLVSIHRDGLVGRFLGLRDVAPGAIVAIQDITEETRKEQELKIKSAMIQEIHHRVKNNLQTIAALLRLQARRTDSEDVAALLQESINRILSVAFVHEFLSKDETSAINIHEVCNRILGEVTRGTLDPAKRISLKLEGQKLFMLPAQQATSCALIINELLQNSVEHAYADRSEGTIVVSLEETDDSMLIDIRDDGRGLPEGFDINRGGLGLQIVRTLVREDLKGDLSIENDGGVRTLISFPRAEQLPTD